MDIIDQYIHRYERNEALLQEVRDILPALIDMARNPGDGGEFEDGEVPELDRARALLDKLEGLQP